ncbi:hypothetical protein [Devosia sp. Leaf420]|uniref:hypothetical protein n=1 Tax=Devosia sp. Leaf420 TaxID=1736374 RepID=UPI0007816270|nr:hypothetical protein [Devosia sp. Leaf420]
MSTNDVTEYSVMCPCGAGTVTFLESIPDHAFARESQREYSAQIDCSECRLNFVVHQQSFGEGKKPTIVSREQVEARKAAAALHDATALELFKSPESKRLSRAISDLVDNEPTMAARHRLLRRLGVIYETLPTFRKRPIGGSEAVSRLGAAGLMRLGCLSEFGGGDTEFFIEASRELAELKGAVQSIPLEAVKLSPMSS